MGFAKTYAHTLLIALDDLGAAVFFNRNDVTISSLCWLQRAADAGDPDRAAKLATLALRPWQHGFLRRVGAGLEWISAGHCVRARDADMARGKSMAGLLT